MKILAIETSCDDTCAAVLNNDKILSSVISSQTDLHATWGGVVPDIAKRAHLERIGPVIAEALKRATKKETLKRVQGDNMKFWMKNIDVIAVTKGPGLAIALGVGINAAKELAIKYNKKLVAVNHVEGHILSNFLKNKMGKPKRVIKFPALALTVSGGHTKLVLVFKIGSYKVIGETLDDAAGEALDKAAKMMGLGYPGGPIIERLAVGGKTDYLVLPRPMTNVKNLDFSFSGLKTSFYYQIKNWPKERIAANLSDLSATYQLAVFDTLSKKFVRAIEEVKPKTLLVSGGVAANLNLRKMMRKVAKIYGLPIFFPFKKELNTDNAAMIGMAGYFMAQRGEWVENIDDLEREARMEM